MKDLITFIIWIVVIIILTRLVNTNFLYRNGVDTKIGQRRIIAVVATINGMIFGILCCEFLKWLDKH